VRLVVDANILYSVLLKTDGAVADVFFNLRPLPELCAPKYLRHELQRHRSRIAKLMGKTVAEVSIALELLLSRVVLIDPSIILDEAWSAAHVLVAQVDPNDEDYVALSIHLNCPLWTGDLKLARALKAGPVTVLSTAEVRDLFARQ